MKRTSKIPQALAVASLVMVSGTGCALGQGSDEPVGDVDGPRVASAPSTAADSADAAGDVVDVDVLRGAVQARLFAEASPEDLAAKMDTVIKGTIAGWADGPRIVNYDERDYSAVLKIKVATSFKASAGSITNDDSYVYVYFPRGGEVIDTSGDPVRNPGAASTVTSLEALEKAAPLGTSLLLLAADEAPLDEGSSDREVKVEDPDAGRPAGAPLLRAHAQGLLLDNNGELASAAADGEPWDWFTTSADGGAAKAPAASNQFAAVVDRLNREFPNARTLG